MFTSFASIDITVSSFQFKFQTAVNSSASQSSCSVPRRIPRRLWMRRPQRGSRRVLTRRPKKRGRKRLLRYDMHKGEGCREICIGDLGNECSALKGRKLVFIL
jgi:hypothetical protein